MEQGGVVGDVMWSLYFSSSQGMLIGFSISNHVSTLLSLHWYMGQPMTRTGVLAICRLMELLKSIQYTFHRQAMSVAEFVTLAIDRYEFDLLLALDYMSVSQPCFYCFIALGSAGSKFFVCPSVSFFPSCSLSLLPLACFLFLSLSVCLSASPSLSGLSLSPPSLSLFLSLFLFLSLVLSPVSYFSLLPVLSA